MAEIAPPRPLRADDDRSGFDCGRASLNEWFRRHAWNNQVSRISRTNVIADHQAIAGSVTLSTAQIERGHLPRGTQRNRPDPIPAFLLGQPAVDLRHQGKGHARSLLQFAPATAVRAAREVGSFCVLTHPLDDGVRAFDARFGFAELPFDPRRSMAVRNVDLERSGF